MFGRRADDDLARRVAELEYQVSDLRARLEAITGPMRGGATAPAVPDTASHWPAVPPDNRIAEVSSDILALVRQGRKIEAIKRYREQYGVGLREAKEAVERLT